MLDIASFVAQDSFCSSLRSFEITTFDFLSFPNEKKRLISSPFWMKNQLSSVVNIIQGASAKFLHLGI